MSEVDHTHAKLLASIAEAIKRLDNTLQDVRLELQELRHGPAAELSQEMLNIRQRMP